MRCQKDREGLQVLVEICHSVTHVVPVLSASLGTTLSARSYLPDEVRLLD